LLLPILFLLALTPLDETGFQKVVTGHKGKVVLYDFWATWCEPCRAELPFLVQLQDKLRAQGFELVTVSANDPEQAPDAEKFLSKLKAPTPAYRKDAKDDDNFINAIDRDWGGALPALFLYDRKGRKVKSFIGETGHKILEAEIRKLL
jgi:thiol-disulfide isomerase/thioredoxin